MAPIWRQNRVLMAYFRTCALKKWGQVFTRVELISILWRRYNVLSKGPSSERNVKWIKKPSEFIYANNYDRK